MKCNLGTLDTAKLLELKGIRKEEKGVGEWGGGSDCHLSGNAVISVFLGGNCCHQKRGLRGSRKTSV